MNYEEGLERRDRLLVKMQDIYDKNRDDARLNEYIDIYKTFTWKKYFSFKEGKDYDPFKICVDIRGDFYIESQGAPPKPVGRPRRDNDKDRLGGRHQVGASLNDAENDNLVKICEAYGMRKSDVIRLGIKTLFDSLD